MGKKEFYEKYIQDNRTEDEKMMQKIHDNARKVKNDELHCKSRNRRNKSVFEAYKCIFASQLIIILLLMLILVKLWV